MKGDEITTSKFLFLKHPHIFPFGFQMNDPQSIGVILAKKLLNETVMTNLK